MTIAAIASRRAYNAGGGQGGRGGQSNSEFSYVITLPLSPAEVQKVYKREREREGWGGGGGGRQKNPM